MFKYAVARKLNDPGAQCFLGRNKLFKSVVM